jgi:beta-aspartyl-peptidase (threonine type)
MEASIMDGRTKNCGAVSGLSTVVHPISLARLVMSNSPHVYLAFNGAEEFARQQGVEMVDTETFITDENREKLEMAKKTKSVELDFSEHAPDVMNNNDNEYSFNKGNGIVHSDHQPVIHRENGHAKANGHIDCGHIHRKKGALHQVFKAEFETVGCTAVDSLGNCAAATSTGGLVNKMSGRIGDTPIVGAGTYANHLCAVSGTGRGEEFIKHTVAKEVAAMMEYKELPLGKAVYKVIHEKLPENMGGLIAVSASGEVAMAFNTPSMFRASAQEGGERMIGIW